jgi:hypothetical protein
MRTAIKLLLGMTAIGGLGLTYLFIVGYDLGQRERVCSEEYYGRDELLQACLYGARGGRP